MKVRQIVFDALGLLGVLDPSESPSAEDYQLGLRTLDGLLKELPLYGYAWPNAETNRPLTWSASTPLLVAYPADYGSDLFLTRTDGTQHSPLIPLTRNAWLKLDQAVTAPSPTHFYEDPDGIYLWPMPQSDPGLLASFVSAPEAADENTEPDVPKSWHLGLTWGLAAHIAPFFAKDPTPFGKVWTDKLAHMVSSAVSTAPVTFTVDEGAGDGPVTAPFGSGGSSDGYFASDYVQ